MRRIKIYYDEPGDEDLQTLDEGNDLITIHKVIIGLTETTAQITGGLNDFFMEECPSAFMLEECSEGEGEWQISPNRGYSSYTHYISKDLDIVSHRSEYEFILTPLIIEVFNLKETVYFKVINLKDLVKI